MPVYEYQCQDCGKVTEQLQKISDPPLSACPACGGTVKKLISAPAFQFKGSGWYVTDYARKGSAGDKGKSTNADTPKTSSESPKAEAKSEAKATSSSD